MTVRSVRTSPRCRRVCLRPVPNLETETMVAAVRHSPREDGKLEITVRGDIAGRVLSMENGRPVQIRHLSQAEALQLTLGRNDAMILESLLSQVAHELPVEEGDDRGQ